MKKYLTALAASLCLAFSVQAQETALPDDEESVATNAFGYPENEPIKIIDNSANNAGGEVMPKPDCDNQALIKQAQEALKEYVIHDTADTIIEKRRQKLVVKNIDNFTPLDIQEAAYGSNRAAAARIIELKINNRLDNQNFKLCQSDNPILSAKLYLLMYDRQNTIHVELINASDRFIPNFVFKE